MKRLSGRKKYLTFDDFLDCGVKPSVESNDAPLEVYYLLDTSTDVQKQRGTKEIKTAKVVFQGR